MTNPDHRPWQLHSQLYELIFSWCWRMVDKSYLCHSSLE